MFTRASRVGLATLVISLACLEVGSAQEKGRLWSDHGLWLAGYRQNVVEELGLTPEQSRVAHYAYGSMRRQAKDEAERNRDRFLRMLSEGQLERLNQITLQHFGGDRALQMPEVAAALSLGDDQKQKIAAVLAQKSKQRDEMLSASNITLQQSERLKTSRQERLASAVKELNLAAEQEKKLAAILERSDADAMQILGHTKMPTTEALVALQREALEQATQVLTEAQREQFQKMLGTPVKYPLH